MHTRVDGHHVGLTFLLLAFLAPLVAIFAMALLPAGEAMTHLTDTVLPRYITNTLGLMLGVTLFSSTMGVITAWLVTTYRFTGHRTIRWALFLPLTFPAYVAAFVYGGIFEYAGPVQTFLRELFGWQHGDYWFPEIRSLYGAALVMSLVFYPYVYLLTRIAFQQGQDALFISRTLGMSMQKAFYRVALPIARPAIIAGITLALMETLADFGAVQHFAVDTFTTGIYRSWFGMQIPAVAAKLSVFLLLFVFVVIAMERFSRGKAQYTRAQGFPQQSQPIQLTGWKNLLAMIACTLPIIFGFVVPLVQLLVWAWQTRAEAIDESFFRLIGNTLQVAGIAALVALAIALFIGYALRFHQSGGIRTMTRFATMGYAVPGSVVAVGILVVFGALDNHLDAWLRANFNISTGLLLSGTIFALIFAYVFRFLAVSVNAVEAGISKVSQEMDWAARMMGLGTLGSLMRVHMPILSGSAVIAFLLVFVEAVKELPATLIIRPFNFETLATHTYILASDERLAESASSALMIVVVGLVPVLVLSKLMGGAKD